MCDVWFNDLFKRGGLGKPLLLIHSDFFSLIPWIPMMSSSMMLRESLLIVILRTQVSLSSTWWQTVWTVFFVARTLQVSVCQVLYWFFNNQQKHMVVTLFLRDKDYASHNHRLRGLAWFPPLPPPCHLRLGIAPPSWIFKSAPDWLKFVTAIFNLENNSIHCSLNSRLLSLSAPDWLRLNWAPVATDIRPAVELGTDNQFSNFRQKKKQQ